ncbi:hypothetical protein USDA257_c26970 [Sinorhizobium fredii USDA 257]|uniref:Uncharacterized protein n=1 Tax=Sinorhizobium fredii (strain USDA 257) TaxID=1185652 RepID=I3X5W5_SINF2|nr:hypothetical protein USDA257_c26970 [Sinorhizobium fredii USDA 257]
MKIRDDSTKIAYRCQSRKVALLRSFIENPRALPWPRRPSVLGQLGAPCGLGGDDHDRSHRDYRRRIWR